MRELTVERDDRTLRVVEDGDPDGVAVLVCNGTPSSRLLYRPWVEAAWDRGIRLFAYDRPGYGGSDRVPGRTVADCAGDAAAVADALGIGRFAVVGSSGGGPHTLACAALLPRRVAAAATLATVAPYDADGLDWLAGMGVSNVEEFGLALAGETELRPFLERMRDGLAGRTVDGMVEELRSLLSGADRDALTGSFAEWLLACTREGIEERVDGWIDDDLAFAAPWGFDVGSIEVPVLLLHGRQDLFVPVAHGEWLALRVSGCEARITDEDGHLTLQQLRTPEVLDHLAAHLR